MARDAIVPTKIARTAGGVAQPAQTTGQAAGHKFINDGHVFAEVENIDGAAVREVIFVTPGTVSVASLGIADLTIEVPLSSIVVIGPFPMGTFNQKSGADKGMVYINYHTSEETDLKVRLYRLP